MMGRVNDGSSLFSALDEERLSVLFFPRKRVVAEASKVNGSITKRDPLTPKRYPVERFSYSSYNLQQKIRRAEDFTCCRNRSQPKRQYYIV